MGTWSATILGNDTSCEVYERFIELYNSGIAPSIIAELVLEEQQENITLVKTDVWLGLALACWECKVLTPEIYSTIKNIVESGEDLEFCKSLDASEEFLKARKKALDAFLTKISIERPKARLIKKLPEQVQSVYLRGMCMVYKNANSKYIGVFVHESEHYKNKGEIYFCFLDREWDSLPDLNAFQEGRLYGLEKLDAKWGTREYCGNVVNVGYEKASKNSIQATKDYFFSTMQQIFTVIGRIEFPENDKWINNIRGIFPRQESPDEFIGLLEKVKSETKDKFPLSDITLKDFLKKLS